MRPRPLGRQTKVHGGGSDQAGQHDRFRPTVTTVQPSSTSFRDAAERGLVEIPFDTRVRLLRDRSDHPFPWIVAYMRAVDSTLTAYDLTGAGHGLVLSWTPTLTPWPFDILPLAAAALWEGGAVVERYASEAAARAALPKGYEG